MFSGRSVSPKPDMKLFSESFRVKKTAATPPPLFSKHSLFGYSVVKTGDFSKQGL